MNAGSDAFQPSARRLQGKVALVTGAGSVGTGWGNGRAIAVRFAQEGARVFGLDHEAARMEETAARIAAASRPGSTTAIRATAARTSVQSKTLPARRATHARSVPRFPTSSARSVLPSIRAKATARARRPPPNAAPSRHRTARATSSTSSSR